MSVAPKVVQAHETRFRARSWRHPAAPRPPQKRKPRIQRLTCDISIQVTPPYNQSKKEDDKGHPHVFLYLFWGTSVIAKANVQSGSEMQRKNHEVDVCEPHTVKSMTHTFSVKKRKRMVS